MTLKEPTPKELVDKLIAGAHEMFMSFMKDFFYFMLAAFVVGWL